MKLSVAILTYNHEPFIRNTIEAVLAQRVNFDYEIVVGEDYSRDGTRSIVMDLYRRFPNRIVPLLHDQNVGALRNLQATLAACRGRYVALVEGDDYWTCEEKLQRQVDCLDRYPEYAICCHRVQIRDETSSGRGGVLPPARFKPGSYSIDDLIVDNFIVTCSVMYRWELLGSLPDWFLGLKYGDWPLHTLVAQFGKIMLMDEVMAVYRMHAGGMWTSGNAIDQQFSLMEIAKVLDRRLNFRYERAIRRRYATCYLELANIARLNENRVATLKYLVASISSGGMRLSRRWRNLAALVAYSVFGMA